MFLKDIPDELLFRFYDPPNISNNYRRILGQNMNLNFLKDKSNKVN